MNPNPAQWNALLAPTVVWGAAYPSVEGIAKSFLDSRPGETFTTNEVVEELYPEQFARGDGIAARKRMFKALAALAEHGLKLYCTRGEPRPLRHSKKMVRPWVWHAAEEPVVKEVAAGACPHCGLPISWSVTS